MSTPTDSAFEAPITRMWNAPDAMTFRGADGTAWRVVECATAQVPGARAARCLIFFSEGTIRRVWDYPTGWRSLGVAEMEQLMSRT